MKQPQKAKVGEVLFRQQLSRQHLGEIQVFPGQPDQKQIVAVLYQRVKDSQRIFKSLLKRKVPISPFLEVGAEKCQRASLLSSKFDAQGFALDISYESLASSRFFAKKLNLGKVPILVCADAENLPFANNSLPFVFAFETLHHFPHPKKVLQEMKRVTADNGYVYFSEEPVKQSLNLALWRRDFNLKSWERLLKKLYLLPFFSTLGRSETKFQVIENEFTLKTWKEALWDFDDVELFFEPVFWGPKSETSGMTWKINPLTKLLMAFEGGGISALAKIQKQQKVQAFKNIYDILACPACHKNLKKEKTYFFCNYCKARYPIKNNVIFLLVNSLFKKLYPTLG